MDYRLRTILYLYCWNDSFDGVICCRSMILHIVSAVGDAYHCFAECGVLEEESEGRQIEISISFVTEWTSPLLK